MNASRFGITKSLDNRLSFLRLFFIFLAFLIIWRLFQLQIINYSLYNARASDQHNVLTELVPVRGIIYAEDKIGSGKTVAIAANQELQLIYAVPANIEDPLLASKELSEVLNLEQDEIYNKISKVNDPYEPLVHYAQEDLVNKVKALHIIGVEFAPENIRHYTSSLFGQVLGFVGEVEDGTKKGRYGIEAYFENELGGQYGELKAEKDVAGALIAVGERDMEQKIDGSDLVLTLDYNIQKFACASLLQSVVKHQADGGSLIVVNPKTGAIEALCVAPTFDPNNYAEAAAENISVFINQAVSTPYEPGSVFKPITMAAALHSGNLTAQTTYTDTGEVKFGERVIKNSDGKANGVQTMINVLEKSLNTGAIFAMQEAGADNFIKMIKAFGFGEKTGITLPAEHAGDVSSINSKKDIYLATASFGQGITATPIQMAMAYSAIANGGTLMKPLVVKEMISATGQKQEFKPEKVRDVMSAIEAKILASMMVTVVESGHGTRASVPGYYIAGKTGTAQVALTNKAGYDPNITIGTFIGFAPVDEPRFVMLVKIDNPKDVKYAESTAAPVFGDVAKFLLDYYQIPPSRTIK